MPNNETMQVDVLPNQSILQSCLSTVDFIKQSKENRSQLKLSINHHTIQNTKSSTKSFKLNELNSIQTARKESFSNWPHIIPNCEVMSLNGWFYCNVSDRVVCIYCNTICHSWTDTDDPYEVHLRLAPECPFVLSLSSSLLKNSPLVNNNNLIKNLNPRHPTMCEISCREKTFNHNSWTQTSPSIDDLVHAGFFYTGNGNTVTCFYCNGTLHQWGINDSPKIEHARWFPDCIYAKHLCGDKLHAKIQLRKKELSSKKNNHNNIDKETLMRLVNARLDLPIVERLRTQYKLSVIKHCIENQLRINNDDFTSDNDLTMACFILQKQIDAIQGNPDKLIIPSQNQKVNNLPEQSHKKIEECVICLTEERQLACMPCGHFCVCVPCGYALRSCPMCRQSIQSFVRIYS